MDYCSARVAVLFRWILSLFILSSFSWISNKMISETGSPIFLTASRYKIYITSFYLFSILCFFFYLFPSLLVIFFTNSSHPERWHAVIHVESRANPPIFVIPSTIKSSSNSLSLYLSFDRFLSSITRNTDTGHTRSVKSLLHSAHHHWYSVMHTLLFLISFFFFCSFFSACIFFLIYLSLKYALTCVPYRSIARTLGVSTMKRLTTNSSIKDIIVYEFDSGSTCLSRLDLSFCYSPVYLCVRVRLEPVSIEKKKKEIVER